MYVVDEPAAPYIVPKNKGKEAMAYLSYIIDFYPTLPTIMAFVHSHEKGWPAAWHTDNPSHSNTVSLRTFNHDYVLKRGYSNLRCNWNPGCGKADLQPYREPRDEKRPEEHNMVEAWAQLFHGAVAPERIGVPCCAQFALSRQQVWKRPREEYVAFRQWLLDTSMEDPGRILE